MKLLVWEGYKAQKCFKGCLFRFMDSAKIYLGWGSKPTKRYEWKKRDSHGPFSFPSIEELIRKEESISLKCSSFERKTKWSQRTWGEAVILVFRVLPQLGIKVWERSKPLVLSVAAWQGTQSFPGPHESPSYLDVRSTCGLVVGGAMATGTLACSESPVFWYHSGIHELPEQVIYPPWPSAFTSVKCKAWDSRTLSVVVVLSL